MGKHARKKQKTRQTVLDDVQPLGLIVSHDDTAKDDEEKRLESILFGKPFKPSGAPSDIILIEDDEDQSEVRRKTKELEQLLDTDLFFVDTAATTHDDSDRVPDFDLPIDISSYLDVGVENDLETEDDYNSAAAEPREHSDAEVAPPAVLKGRKAPVWTDPDDTTLQVSLASDRRLRKLRDAPIEDTVSGREYEVRLRRQFEKINPAPEWASSTRKTLHRARSKRRRTQSFGSASEVDDVDDMLPDLLSSTRGLIGNTKSKVLQQDTLSIERLRDANQTAKSEEGINAVHFHPSPKVPVLLTASTDRRLRLFNIDGHTNPHLQTLHIPELPITNALFHPTGSSILLTGPRPFYYTYDLQSGATHRSPRGLWGTTFNNSNPSAQDASMELCAFSPGGGEVLAVAGRRGYVHLVDWKSGAGQVVGSVKMNAGVKALSWVTSGEARELMTLGEDAEVYVWDVGERRCLRRWKDDGGFGSVVMSAAPGSKYLGIGSTTGFVNVYSSDGIGSTSSSTPKPLKTIANLTTSISTLTFNHDAQLLAIASNAKKDQMRLIHLPSLTAFSNWPTSSTPLGHVTAVDFSARSEYIAVGNNRGRVLLYHLRDFTAT